MSDTFKSGQWRICSHCLGPIKPKDRVTYLHDEIACMDCLTDSEDGAAIVPIDLPPEVFALLDTEEHPA